MAFSKPHCGNEVKSLRRRRSITQPSEEAEEGIDDMGCLTSASGSSDNHEYTKNPTVETKIGLIKCDRHAFEELRRRAAARLQSPPPNRREICRKFYPPRSGGQRKEAGRVVVCYEAGCFGCREPARRMQQLGAEVLVVAPQDWDEQGKRQVNDQLDAAVMCRRLSDYLCGHRRALSVVRILRARRKRPVRKHACAATASADRPDAGHGPKSFAATRDGRARALVVGGQLAAHPRADAGVGQGAIGSLGTSSQWPAWLQQVEAALAAAAPQELFVGEGELSHELLKRELVDPHRFKNMP